MVEKKSNESIAAIIDRGGLKWVWLGRSRRVIDNSARGARDAEHTNLQVEVGDSNELEESAGLLSGFYAIW